MNTAAEEIWAILREVAKSQKETDQSLKETEQVLQEMAAASELSRKEAEQSSKEFNRKLKELGKQIGGLGEKFGSFTEGLALPSMQRILTRKLGMEVVMPSVRVSKGERHLELDVLAYANGTVNQAYVVEVKSHPRTDSLEQLATTLTQFRVFFPEHAHKALFGILAGVDWTPTMREAALKAGFHVATIHDNVFALQSPKGFQPKGW